LAQFKEQMKAINVRKIDYIVVYDKIGKVSAPRAYWILKNFGLEKVAILNGSFSKWVAEGRNTEDGDNEKAFKKILSTDIKVVPEDFDFKLDTSRIRYYDEIVKISNFNLVASDTKGPDAIKIIDTRLEPVYDLGHIPSSINIPFTNMLNPDKTFKSADQLREIFINAGIQNPES